jgi:hypothetical protein
MSLIPKLKLDHAPTPDEQDWLHRQLAAEYDRRKASRKQNPLVAIYGPGPEGAKCKTCASLTYHTCSKRYYKCTLRGITHGPKTDHLVNWPACAKYTLSVKPEAPRSMK